MVQFIRRWVWGAGTAALVAWGLFGAAAADPAADALTTVTQAARDRAAAAVPDKTDPKYFATLRALLSNAADNLNIGAPNLGTRAISVASGLATIAIPTVTVTPLDQDRSYQLWLSSQVVAKNRSLDGFDHDGTRSIGGTLVQPGNKLFDSVVLLQSSGTQMGPFCSGVLLTTVLVVTAAHCICLGLNFVVVGNNPNTDQGVFPQVSQVYQPPDFDCAHKDATAAGHDYALIVLDSAASGAHAVVAPDAVIKGLTNGNSVWAAGFGVMSDGGGVEVPAPKNYVQAPIISASCSRPDWLPDGATGTHQSDAQYYNCKPGQELVSQGIKANGSAVAGGPCDGDSGGAIFASQSDAAGSGPTKPLFLVGIISRSPSNGADCGGAMIYSLLNGTVRSELAAAAANMGVSFPP